MLELDHIGCILDIAETGSFSRTAERMGIAQSVVSKRVRRVEEQLGLRIFARSSRLVELTRQGRAFLPFAQAMIDAEVAARYAARNLHEEMANQLVLGTYDHRINYRLELMDAFHAAQPEARMEVQAGSRAALLAALRTGQIDVAVIAAPVGHGEPDFAQVRLPQLQAYLLVPSGHPLFAQAEIANSQLHGLELVYSPSHLDPLMRTEISSRLMRHGVRLVMAPEADRSSMERFADIRGLPMLLWERPGRGRHLVEGKAAIGFAGVDLRSEIVVHATKEGQRPVAASFLETARKMGEAILRGDTDSLRSSG